MFININMGINLGPAPTELLCPITGSKLLYIGTEQDVMDPDAWYSPESNSQIIFARHPFSRKIFRQIDRKSLYAKALRYFRLNDDNSWTELKKIPNGDDLFPINTPEDDPSWIESCQVAFDRVERQRQQNEYWDQHPEEDPRVRSKCIASELVSVQPMSAPLGILNYVDFVYNPPKENFIRKVVNFIKLKIRIWQLKRNYNIKKLIKLHRKYD